MDAFEAIATMLLLFAATRGLVLSSGLAPPARAGVPVAALSEPPSASAGFPADLSALTRRELQQLAKRMGVRANQKSVDMITELLALVAAETGGAAKPGQAKQRAPSEPRQASAPERQWQARAPERRQEASAPEQANPNPTNPNPNPNPNQAGAQRPRHGRRRPRPLWLRTRPQELGSMRSSRRPQRPTTRHT